MKIILKKIKMLFCDHDWKVEQNEFYWYKRTCLKCNKVIDLDAEKQKRWAKEDKKSK